MHRIRLAVSLCALSLSAACGGDSTQPLTVVGTWNLSTINGAPLPFLVQAADPKIDLLDDAFVFSSGGTFTETEHLRFTPSTGGVTTQPFIETGTWTLSGTALTVHFNSDGTTGTATVSGNTFVVAGQDGLSGVYTKQ